MAKPLSPHRYTGHYLERHHTSYAALGFLLLVFGVILGLATNAARADSGATTVISATVTGAPPTFPPTITTPANGTHFSSTPITVAGACTAGYQVAAYKNTILAGSTICANDDTYSLQIDLFDGENDLTARQFDFLDQAGPLSSVTVVYYDAPVATPSPTPSTTPSGGGSTGKSTPSPTPLPIQQFTIGTHTPYLVGSVGNEFSLPVELLGGIAPYALSTDWGDGTTTVASITGAGSYTTRHTYTKPGNYEVVLQGSDSKGNKAYFEELVIVDGTTGVGTASGNGFLDGGQLLILWPLYILMVIMLLSFWLGERYEFFKVKSRLRQQERELLI